MTGINSILELVPRNGASVAFNVSDDLCAVTTYTLIPDLDTLDLHEDERRQYVYSDSVREGGYLAQSRAPLVKVTLDCVLKATSRAHLAAGYNALHRALAEGGSLKFKPEGATAGAPVTFYVYLPSPPPRLLDLTGNRWDAAPKNDRFFTLYLGLELQTQPIATSDPAAPETIAALSTTLDNWNGGGLAHNVLIPKTQLKGSLPALVRLLLTPASGQVLGRVLLWTRSAKDSVLADLATCYEAESATPLEPDTWIAQSDATRGGGGYRSLDPPETFNGHRFGLRFALTHPEDLRGRFAVIGVGYDGAAGAGAWRHQVQLRAGNVAQVGADDYFADRAQQWCMIYAGEFDLPLTNMSALSDNYQDGPYLEWYSRRLQGADDFRLDGVFLVQVSDADLRQGTALDVQCETAGGVTSADVLLIENLPGNDGLPTARGYVAAANGKHRRVLRDAPRGDFVTLDPAYDHLLHVIHQQGEVTPVFADNFDGYAGSKYLLISALDDPNWSVLLGAIEANDEMPEGEGGVRFSNRVLSGSDYAAQISKAKSVDLTNGGAFTASDFVSIVHHVSSLTYSPTLKVKFVSGAAERLHTWTVGQAGIHTLYQKLSAAVGSGSLSGVTSLWIESRATDNDVRKTSVDYLRIEKADPANAARPNATGGQWRLNARVAGERPWTVANDIYGAGGVLACMDEAGGDGVNVALFNQTNPPPDRRIVCRVMLRDPMSGAGIVWDAHADFPETAGGCFMATLNASGWIRMQHFISDGSSHAIENYALTDTALQSNVWYTLGVRARGFYSEIYLAPTATLAEDYAIFAAAHRKLATMLMTIGPGQYNPNGYCGVHGVGNARFDRFAVYRVPDAFAPDDQITLSGKAVFRTIAPFA